MYIHKTAGAVAALIFVSPVALAMPHALQGPVASVAPPALRAFGASPQSVSTQHSLNKLDSHLAQLAVRNPGRGGAELNQLRALNPSARFRLRPPLDTPEVLIDATANTDADSLRTALQSLGLADSSQFSNAVGGWLPVNRLAEAAGLQELRQAHASRPRTRSGAVMSQGDFAQRTDLVRSAASPGGLDGTGVTVGVLSDSFNCYQIYQDGNVPASGAAGYAPNGFLATFSSDTATGDLPSSVAVLKEGDCFYYDIDPTSYLPLTDEGRAMLQIVHDVAPGASLSFYTAFDSETDFANGILALASAGAKVIVDDVSYSDEPFYQDGILSQAVDQVAAQGVLYFSAAGNNGIQSFETTSPSFPVLLPSGPQNPAESLLNFNTSGGSVVTVLPITLPALAPGQFINFVVEWDQPYVTGAPAGSAGASSVFDVCLTDANGNIRFCGGPNTAGGDAVNFNLSVGNPVDSGGNTAVESDGVMIGLVSGPVPGRIKLVIDDGGAGSTINAYATNSPTLQGHPGANGASAVGAAFYYNTVDCYASSDSLEAYSARGGDPILFDTSGQLLETPITRQRPNFVGPDGADNTFLGFTIPAGSLSSNIPSQCKDYTNYPNFFGTSAAAPHVAAAAALLLQAAPTASPAQIISALQSTAVDMETVGYDYDSGFGFIKADAALNQLVPQPPPPPPPSSGGGGGGSFAPPTMLVLALLAGRRRRRSIVLRE